MSINENDIPFARSIKERILEEKKNLYFALLEKVQKSLETMSAENNGRCVVDITGSADDIVEQVSDFLTKRGYVVDLREDECRESKGLLISVDLESR